ncbi:MAG: SPOR domain-containing protein [Deltaproteobacteria bacterium]|nr:SPOR domain-containing protein [Deltaproteobacteria bacterium]MBW2307443.1 SPOR domain-containing protein [Deltaproteobacteria bacterium]
MSEGKLFNIGSKRTLLLLSLLLVVSFTVLLVTLLREPEPPGRPGKTGESQSPQMVRGKIQLPKAVEVSVPAAPPAKPTPLAPPEQKPLTETAATSQTTGGEPVVTSASRAEEPKPAEKIQTAATEPVTPREKPAPAVEKPPPPKAASVEIRGKPAVSPAPVRRYTVQVGAFSKQSTAEKFASRLRKSGFDVRIQPGPSRGGRKFYRVQVGAFSDILEAKKMEARLQARKDITSTLVKRIK